MQDHHAGQKANERLAVASGWKRLWDEHRVGPVEARRHRRWSQAGLVGVDHDGEEWWKLERPCICDIPCTSDLLVSEAAEFFLSCCFLVAFFSTCASLLRDVTFCVGMCVCVCVVRNTFCVSSFRLALRIQLLVSGP